MVVNNIIQFDNPETLEEVETVTGEMCRTMKPDMQRRWLRCQIGTCPGVDSRGFALFRLKAFGTTWAEAYDMWRRREASLRRKKEVVV